MRTPAQIARLLGWPEAQVPVGACLHARLIDARDCRTCGPTVADELADAQRPRLWIFRHAPGWWVWDVRGVDTGTAPSQPAALALGLAALETASVEHRPQVHAQPVDNLGGWR